MNKTKVWISSMRLRTLPLSVSGIILASFLAAYQGVFNWVICVLAILSTLSFQILSNLANDYGDGVKGTDNDDRIGPERAIQSGVISPIEMKRAITINVAISVILALLTVYYAFGQAHFFLAVLFFALGVAAIIAAIKYTVGGNAYGYNAMGDVFVFLFFGLVSVIGGYILYAKTIDFVVVLPAVVIGLLSTAVLNLNNMRDIESDTKSNKITLALKLGSQKAKAYHITLVVSAILLSVLFGVLFYNSPFNFIFIIAFIPLFLHLKKVNNTQNPKHFDPELKKLALTTVLLSILMGLGQVL
ncbi:1,4-dihydroxy-2-naphthoate octaprenyltransferase [Algibacter lectus]|uniref:1,4-dihydroxy-2-naphthoate octaprenyltransferase n=1 Tax=Algibacter lectus TaxID=221126 RepID=A0A4R8MCB3_9FLAO|nr:1,4-dihydroxy-2-naphthoate octaprenyltransferase [Algibacter lectus]MWW26873.1 1,4-dihydroxy-2-naphthoate octaprenyltransferase [Algibacter lectus]TDY63370.1 1,4-dihydroxy-2-naphthoate prenyltransferase [Algibacter lectus]